MTAAEIARALGARRSGRGWLGRCPGHQDRSPSLSIAERGGRVLVHCFAGCAQENVIEALRSRGLWASRPAPDLTAEERRERAEQRRRDARDARPAHYWALAAEALALELLEHLPFYSPQRGALTDLTRIARCGGRAALEEFRAWRTREPKLTAAMVAAGESLDRRRQFAALAALLRREEAQ